MRFHNPEKKPGNSYLYRIKTIGRYIGLVDYDGKDIVGAINPKIGWTCYQDDIYPV